MKTEITVSEIHNRFNSESTKKKITLGVVLILLCGLILTVLSSELILFNDYDYRQIRLSDIVNRVNEEYDGLDCLDGVTMRTELEVYSPETMRILIYWENNTDLMLAFGEPWQLFKKRGDKFIPVIRTSGDNYGWSMPAYPVKPGRTRKHIYWIKPFTDKLTPGTYKIKTDFRDDEAKIYYLLEAEFEVSNDKSKCGVSALDFLNGENEGKFRDITGGSWGFAAVHGNTDFRLYKNKTTYDTILTDGVNEYEIEKGGGKWGVVNNQTYEADNGRIYLVYSYSREENGGFCSYLCVLDITENSDVKEVYRSDSFTGDYIVGFGISEKLEEREDGRLYAVLDENGDFVIDNRFGVFFVDWHESDEGYGGSLGEYIGRLVYKNGGFSFEEGDGK